MIRQGMSFLNRRVYFLCPDCHESEGMRGSASPVPCGSFWARTGEGEPPADSDRRQRGIHRGRGGTDLTLTETGVPSEWRKENLAGWVSVLLALKAAVDHGVDLRVHDTSRT